MSKTYRRMLSITLIIILIFQQSYEVLAKSNISEGITNLTSIGISKFNFSNIIKNSNNTNKEDKIKEEENKKLLEDISELKAQEKKREATNEEYTKLQEPVITLVRSVNEKTNIITWSGMSNSKYEIEIDDKVIDVNSNRTYIHRNLKPGSEHTYRVRLKNDKGKSEWSKKATVKTLDKRNKSNNILDNITKSNEITSRASTNFSFTEEYTHAHLTTSVHIINRGWLETEDDEVSGDVGDTVDQIKIKLNNVAYGVKIKYRAYVEGIGWQPWVYDGSIVGVSGKQIQAIEAKIVQVIEGNVEKDAEGVSIQYVLYCADFSNVNTISRNGETSGIIGKSASAFWASLINSDEYIKEVISKDTKWTLAGSPYVIKGELIINQGVRLEIDPGVKVIFQKYASRTNGVEVNGKLAVNGTASSPVLFTYSEDGKLVTQDRYSYKGIKITPTGELVGNNINIEFKGKSFSHITNNGKLDLNNSKVTTINGAAGNYSTGILVQSQVNTLVQNSIITNCINGFLLRDSGGVIQLQGNKITKSIFGISIVNSFVSNSGQININNNELSDNENGIEVENKESKINKISIEGNRILRSKYSGIKYYADDITNVTIIKNTITETDSARQYSGGGPIYIELNGLRTSSGVNFNNINPKDISLKNNLTNNNYDSVVISGTLSENLFLSKGLSNYLIDTHLIIPENVTLDIEPGTVINIRGYIQVNGKLNAEGKSLSPIIFTSINDSTNGITHKPTTGYNVYRDNNFEAIYVSDKGEFRGVNTRVRNGGRNFQEGVENYPSNFKVWGNLTLINSEVGNSLTNGIFGTGNLIIINTKLYDCINYGVFAAGNLTLTNSKLVKNKRGLTFSYDKASPSIISNSFIENSEYGIFNGSNITIDAAYNYWGSQYGPSFYDWDNSQMIKNGDEVSSKINFKPYLAAEYSSNLGDDFNKYINSLEYRNEKHFGLEGTNSATGNFSKSYQDLEAKFGDLDIKLTRTYNSLDNKDSIMGKGWRFGFQGEISDYTNEAGLKSKIIKLPNGSAQSFRQNSDGTYTANDSRNKLVKQSDNTFVLTTKEQNKYCFSNGKLVWIKDKNDNTISIEFNLEGKIFKITDYTGRIFTINYANGLLTNITETINGVAGRNINYSYLNSLLSKAEDSMGNITIYEYDTNKQLNKIKDKNGNILESIIYIQEGDSKGKVKEHKDIFGNNHIYNYDNLNNRTLITDSNNKTIEQWYDNEKFITFTVYPDRTISFIEYFLEDGINKYGEIKSEVNRNKVTNNYERDSNGNIIKIVNADLSHKSFSYDENNNLVRESDENGHFTFYIYDSKKRNLIKKVQPIDGISEYKEGVDDSKYAITKYEYYSEEETIQQGYKIKALLKKVIDAEGNSITNTYDSSGNILSVTNQEGKVTTFQYDNLGNMKNEISPNKYITQFVHDKNGNLEKKVMHGGETTRIIYDSLGRKVKEISGKLYNSSLDDLSNHSYSGDHGSRSSYLLNGKIEWIKDAENNLTKYNYDLYGNVKTEIKPNGAIYIYEYDDMNRITKIYFKENASLSQILLEENEYIIISDGATQKINKKYANDNENIITYSTYDYNNRLIEQKNADNTVIKIKYNPNGTKNSETDENGNTTYFEYDGLNRLIKQLVPFEDTSGIKKYTYSYLDYDKNGNKVVEKTGKHGVEKDKLPESYITVNYSYYKDGKIKSTIDNEGRKNEYFYDDDGYLSSEHNYLAADKKIITNFTNNYLGKPITKTQYIQSCDLYGNELNDLRETQLVTTYTYDKNGNLETITTPSVKTSSNYTHPSITTTYTYDNLNRKTGEGQPGKDEYGNDTIIKNTIEYNWEGNKSKNTDPLNRITQYIYNQRGWIDKVIDAKGGVTAYYYDRIGRKIAEVSPKNYDTSKNLSQMERTEFTYDPMGRVKTIVNKFNSKEVNQTTYQWIDKWVEVVFKAYKYDGKGNIIKELDALGYESGTGTIADDKINSGFGTEYTYNLANKLITKLDPVSKEKNLQYTTKFDYDALGRKISEINGKGIITINEYDDAGNITKVKIKKGINEPEQILQTKKYDLQNRLIQLVDSKNNAITYEYNTFNKIKKEVHPGDDTISENVISYQYSTSGDLIKKKNSEGTTNIYSYDNQGRVLSETISKDTSDEPNNIIIKSAYDKVGNKRFEYDGNGNVKENAFDEINRIKTSKVTVTNIDGVKSNQVTTFDYDKNGNEISVTDWRNNTYSKSYDGINRLVEKRDPYAIIQKLEYNHNNVQIKSYDALNNLTEYNYDKNNRLIATIDPERNRITQSYGSDGNIEWKADGKNNKTVYEYNELNKLSKVINAKYETTLYSYDLNGNLLTQVDGVDCQAKLTPFYTEI
ncbi:YD repeat-containing protein [Clostridium amylolyticum]|uniref:YD repeat-containing protein n=1 Tax=Clostridium amylolyticum TaxID=1121298 RepID=A0A1M6NTU5_9CLOT|nr:DUF6531 domain-containing protein [Clostridium amylolyticum]SHJ99141.1 YD repeat-containing protein [Clostridium amylolyticum]